jgi:hypothetical protein
MDEAARPAGSRRQPPDYALIGIAAATIFPLMLMGGYGLWLHCDLIEVEITGFHRSVCHGALPGIGVLLILFAPLGTAVAGLVSREHGRSPVPFYVLWAGSIVVALALLTLAGVLD